MPPRCALTILFVALVTTLTHIKMAYATADLSDNVCQTALAFLADELLAAKEETEAI